MACDKISQKITKIPPSGSKGPVLTKQSYSTTIHDLTEKKNLLEPIKILDMNLVLILYVLAKTKSSPKLSSHYNQMWLNCD